MVTPFRRTDTRDQSFESIYPTRFLHGSPKIEGMSTPGRDHELRLQDCASSGADKLSTTFRTPSTDCAVFSASSFSAREETLPVKVTVPLSAWICTVFKEIALVEYSSNSTRCASLSSMLSGFVCAFAALRLSVTPCTPGT